LHAAFDPHPLDFGERRVVFARDPLNDKVSLGGFAAQSTGGHAAVRERALGRGVQPERGFVGEQRGHGSSRR